MGLFAKIAIAIFINSTPLELTFVQVWDRSPIPFPRYSAFCAMTHKLLNSRNYGLKVLLCACMRSPYTTRARKSTMGGVCRSNVPSEWMATKTARLWCSSASFSVPLEKKFCYLTNSPSLGCHSNYRSLATDSVDSQLLVLDARIARRYQPSVAG